MLPNIFKLKTFIERYYQIDKAKKKQTQHLLLSALCLFKAYGRVYRAFVGDEI